MTHSTHDVSHETAWLWPTALVLLVLGIYGLRLGEMPLQGEESRRALVALEMRWAGDFITPRQQGEIYTSRAPLGSWLMLAMPPWTSGMLDPVAIRLPSVLATLLMSLVLYYYARCWMTRFGAFATAVAFLSMFEMMNLGRLAESDAVFGALVASSLLLWHAGWTRKWPIWLCWSVAYALVAAGMLTKGLQAPVYFAGVIGLYLLVNRQLGALFRWPHLVGLAVFLVLFGSYTLALAIRTDWSTVQSVYLGLLTAKLTGDDIVASPPSTPMKLLTFPFVFLACLLPWCLYLWHYARPSFRQQLTPYVPMLTFLLLAVLVIFPTVWVAAVPRARYLTPLFPILACLIGVVLERLALAAPGTWDRLYWRVSQWLFAGGFLIAAIGVAVVSAWASEPPWTLFAQSTAWVLFYGVLAVGSAWLVVQMRHFRGQLAAATAMTVAAVFLGVTNTGIILNSRIERAADLAGEVQEIRSLLDGERLVSVGLIPHPFRYYWGELIPACDPDPADLPDGVRYVAVQKHPWESIQEATSELPFDWKLVAYVNCEPTKKFEPDHWGLVIVRRLPNESIARGDRRAATSQR